ncbi:MAG: decaprenyl-phosphate phosphoribosyltransferase [Gemmatimonadaceae bacterium]|nr:decaprenyl-phosphate phosphoribosyltransferase [Gemmatimonadaceae bacterium]
MPVTHPNATTPPLERSAAVGRASVRSWARLLRPHQWVKNFFVLAPLLFSGRALDPASQRAAALAFAVFCLAASAVYVLNDIVDREQDRAHPGKRNRPIASGAISVAAGIGVAALLVALALGTAWYVGTSLLAITVAYLLLNVVYSVWIKQVVILDVFAIAAFFVLRLVAGAAAVQVRPSVWLILCGGLLSLYLGFAKRRHELVLLGEGSQDHRAVLSQYSTPFLDQLSVVLLAVTIVSYIMYTLESETARLVGGEVLSYSTVFVLYGVLRYLYLVHRRQDGNPSETLLNDRGLLLAVTLWVLYCGVVIYRAGPTP